MNDEKEKELMREWAKTHTPFEEEVTREECEQWWTDHCSERC